MDALLSVAVGSVIFFSIIGMVYFAIIVKKSFRLNAMERHAVEILEDYKPRLNGNNRFLVNHEILEQMFPYDSKEDVGKVFARLAEKRIIDRDPMDNAWCIR